MRRKKTTPALRPAGTVLEPSGDERRRVAEAVLRTWLADSPTGSTHTRRAKERDLDAFACWAGLPGRSNSFGEPRDAVEAFLFGGFARAHELVQGWMAWQAEKTTDEDGRPRPRFAPSTRARRLAHLRSLVRVAQAFGLPWGLHVRGPKVTAYRDASGPEAWRVYQVIAALTARATSGPAHARRKAARDSAILQLMFVLGLRRASVAALTLADYEGTQLWIHTKGEEETIRKTLPRSTSAAIEAWLEHRGREPGPLFTGVRSGSRGRGLADGQIYRIAVAHISNPHGLRHAGATKLAREGHSVFALQAHLGHRSPMTAQHYVDAHEDAPGAASAYLAAELDRMYDAP